jgi:hypothetical protein
MIKTQPSVIPKQALEMGQRGLSELVHAAYIPFLGRCLATPNGTEWVVVRVWAMYSRTVEDGAVIGGRRGVEGIVGELHMGWCGIRLFDGGAWRWVLGLLS